MSNFGAFLIALKMMESGGDYQIVNSLNFIGAYQFGEAALIDLGYVSRDRDPYDNNFSGGWTGKNGINSTNQFLNAPAVQDDAAVEWMHVMWGYIEDQQIDSYAWTEVGAMELTPSGMLAAAHLLGAGSLAQYIKSDGRADLRDPYGMPLSNYIEKLNGYDIPFGPGDPQVVALNN
ncbi:hypothetical protein [Yoonia sp.]|uniref:hypothetical protein n=1 Tax=Yoonia sp. TaxID=2212373 RepID=UPI0025E1980E|nr:hypothetical protein [Yoonia sp.]